MTGPARDEQSSSSSKVRLDRDTVRYIAEPVLAGLLLAAWMAPFVFALALDHRAALVAGAGALAATVVVALVDRAVK